MPAAVSKRFEQTVTDVALLQLDVRNLHDKVDELKIDVKDVHDCLDRNMTETREFLKEFQDSQNKQHAELADKVSSIEKIKWMLMGAAAIAGATGLEAFKMIVGS